MLSRIPAPVAVGVSPYVGNISDVIARARAAQREVYVTLPMQSAHPERVDEGAHALGYGNSATDDLHELDWCLGRAAGASGLTDASENGDDQPGGGYATSPDFAPIADVISSRGLLYLAGNPQDKRHTRGMTATTWIGGDTDGATLDDQFAALVPHDRKPTNMLVMVGPLTPIVIDRLSNWLQSPAAANLTLVAPSVFVDDGLAAGTSGGAIAAQTATFPSLQSVAPL